MTGRLIRSILMAVGSALMISACGFNGLNSIPLPGATGRGAGAETFHVEIANVATLVPNSPVLISNVVVGSVGQMKVKDGHADIEVSVQPGTVVPANAVATIGQTSLLGSMHLALDPPPGQAPTGAMKPGTVIPLDKASTYPSTEQTLSALSLVVNGGGLGQIGDVIHNFNAAFTGRESEIRDLLSRFDSLIALLNRQRDNIVATLQSLNDLGGTLAGQSGVIDRALKEIPPALDILVRERAHITTALEKLGTFSDTASSVIRSAQDDLVSNLKHVEPVIKVLADIGPEIDMGLAAATIYPYTQSFVDRAVRGDYVNLFSVMDLTVPRLKRTLFLGTRWGQLGAPLVPAPGDPYYLNYTYNPLSTGLGPTPQLSTGDPGAAPAPVQEARPPMPAVHEPLVPVVPPPGAGVPSVSSSQVFAGPYPTGGG